MPGPSQADPERTVARGLAKTVYFYLDRNAGLQRTEFPKPYSSVARNLVRGILSAQQFVLPPSHEIPGTWSSREIGAQAPYSARYSVLPGSGGLTRVSKT